MGRGEGGINPFMIVIVIIAVLGVILFVLPSKQR